MAEQIISKRCYKCKQIKPLLEFHKNQTRKDGHANQCKTCCLKYQKKYRQTEHGKATQKLYFQSEKGKAAKRKARIRYFKTERGKSMLKEYRIQNPKQEKAKHAVSSAIRAGKLPRPDTLQCHCGPEKAEQYHHHKGYAPENWLNVVPVCINCHKKIHQEKRRQSIYSVPLGMIIGTKTNDTLP